LPIFAIIVWAMCGQPQPDMSQWCQ